ncbi:hypothetical protein D3C78_1363820 [compost metagenome]
MAVSLPRHSKPLENLSLNVSRLSTFIVVPSLRMSGHGLGDKLVDGLGQHIVHRLARHRLTADFQHDRNGERRDMFQRAVGGVTLDSLQHIAKTANVQKSSRGIAPRRFQQDMIRLMAAKNVINKIGGDRDLTARLFLAGMAAFDEA